MEKKEKRQTKERKNEDAERVGAGPVAAQEGAQIKQARPPWSCCDCIFCVSNLLLWARTLASGFPVSGQCVNQPEAPDQMRETRHGRTCRNF